jgi:fatty acid desaturase
VWFQAWETGTCPSCGRYYDPSLEPQVELMAQDAGVVQRARDKRSSAVALGLLLIGLTVLLYRVFGVALSHLFPLLVTGLVIAIVGAFHTARKQARTELTEEREETGGDRAS